MPLPELCEYRLCPEVISAIAARYEKDKVTVRLAAGGGEEGAVPFAMTRWYISERSEKEGSCPCFTLVLD